MKASINNIPYLLFKFKNANFEWANKKEGIGNLNARKVVLKELPIYIIFLIKSLPILLFTFYISNKFVLTREFISIENGKMVAIVGAIALFTAIYSLFVRRGGGYRIAIFIASLLVYILTSFYSIHMDYAWAMETGIASVFYMCLIIFAFSDIFLILAGKKQMYYISNGYPQSLSIFKKKKNKQKKEIFNFKLEGLFLNLYEKEEA